MKILVTVFDIQDYGGIIQHTELLLRGLHELGHDLTFRILRNAARPPYRTSQPIAGAAAFPSWANRCADEQGVVDAVGPQIYASQTYGWRGAQVQCYGDGHHLKEWKNLANAHDLVIHELPVAKADPEGWWSRLYEGIRAPQIAIAHDAHFRTLYPHMIAIARHLTGVACTNHAGYRALEWLPVPRAFIASGHVPLDWKREIPWKKRQRRFVCAHIWKKWKNMDLVIRAIPHLPKGIRNLIGGDGIERRYMTSKEKCKSIYFDGKKRIWDQAIFAGMDFRGDMKQAELLAEYGKSRVMVDMSYSAKFAALGNHFNRSTFDAYNGGCVPLCTEENMREQPSQFKMFDKGATHLEVPHDVSPQELAKAIGWACDLDETTAKQIIKNGRHLLLEKFHYIKAAQDYLNLAKHKSAGIYKKLETGTLTKEIKDAARKHLASANEEAE